MTEIFLEKTTHGMFVPATDADREKCKAWRAGDVLRAKVSKPRNGRNHRRFFKLLNTVAENLDDGPNVEQLVVLCKYAVGYVDEIVDSTGEVKYQPKSIDFASMDEAEFRVFYSESSKYLCREWLFVDPMELEEIVGLL